MTRYRRVFFPALAGVLWLVFLVLDLTRAAGSTWVKFAAISLCWVTSLLQIKTRDDNIVASALSLTLIADWFLLVRNDRYTLGVCLFLLVQALYAYRLYRLRGRPSPLAWLRLGLLLLAGFLSLTEPTLFQLWCVALYFTNLCLNTVEAFALGKSCRVFAWGLLLFVCCDLCVGAWNISLFLPPALGEFARVGMWLFYLPSQVLIVLSRQPEMEALHEKNL